MQPEGALGASPVRIAAVAADFAAATLAQRFAAPGSSGIDELVAAAAAGVLLQRKLQCDLRGCRSSQTPIAATASIMATSCWYQGRQAPMLLRRLLLCRTGL